MAPTCAPRKVEENQGAVECISGRVGSAVDSCEMKLRDGTTYCYGPPFSGPNLALMVGQLLLLDLYAKKFTNAFFFLHLLPATL